MNKPDYAAHETVYARLKQTGAVGWDDEPEYSSMIEQLRPAMNRLSPGSCVLELGCGAGNLAMKLAESGYEVHGTDISPTAVAWANDRAASRGIAPNFLVDNVVDLRLFRDGQFDAVIDAHCLHCIIGDDRSHCLAAVRRVLKPGGLFAVLTMCGEVSDPRHLAQFDAATRIVSYNGKPTRYIGMAQDLIGEITAAGFKVLEHRVDERTDNSQQDNLVLVAAKEVA